MWPDHLVNVSQGDINKMIEMINRFCLFDPRATLTMICTYFLWSFDLVYVHNSLTQKQKGHWNIISDFMTPMKQ